ncbi:MAG: FkbM family methyltransferase [Thermomicrobiales bacterium]
MSLTVRSGRYYAWSVMTLLTRLHRPFRIIRRFLGSSRFGEDTITLRKSDLSFLVRSKMDIWSVKETVLDRCYEFYGYPLEPNWTIVDIGAAIGDFSVLAGQDATNRVFAYEPFPESFDVLKRNIALNKLDNVEAISHAVAGFAGQTSLDVSGGEPLRMGVGADVASTSGGLSVEAVSLSDVIEHIGGGPVDFLKLDCEGAEYDILMSASTVTLSNVHRIVLEYHLIGESSPLPGLVGFLKDAGYLVEHVPSVMHPEVIGYLRAIRSRAV